MCDLLYLISSRGPRAPSGDGSAFAKQVVDIGSTKGVMVTYVRDPGHFQVHTHHNSLIVVSVHRSPSKETRGQLFKKIH